MFRGNPSLVDGFGTASALIVTLSQARSKKASFTTYPVTIHLLCRYASVRLIPELERGCRAAHAAD